METLKFKGVIFDFDGTLVRSHRQVYDIITELTRDTCPVMPTPEQLRELSTLEALQILGVKLWQVPRMTVLARRMLKDRLADVEFEPGMLSLLEKLHREGRQLTLVSSNSVENISTLLKKNQAQHYFAQILSGSSMLGKHRNISRMVKRMTPSISQIVYIGDETRDIEASQKVGVKCVAVAWGFHSKKKLQQHNPDFLVESVEDLGGVLFSREQQS